MKNLENFIRVKDNRISLQRMYVCLSVASFVIASFVSLLDHNIGQKILFLTLLFAVIFLTNAVVWTLMEGFLDSHSQILSEDEPKKEPQSKSKKGKK